MRKKRRLKLYAAIVLSVFLVSIEIAGCGIQGSSSGEESNGQNSEEKVSTEESVPQELREAFTLGIADTSLQGKLDDPCSQQVATRLLYDAYKLRRSEENLYYNDMLTNAKENKTATRYWMAQGMYYANLQYAMDEPYTNYNAWMKAYCDFSDESPVPEDVRLPDAMMTAPDPETGKVVLYGCTWDGGCLDNDLAFYADEAKGYARYEDFGSHVITTYAALLYDRRNGDKVMNLDENANFNPQKELTVAEAISITLRYYFSFEDEQQSVAFRDIASFDSQYITEELLSRDSVLPDASCANLPKDWQGVLVDDLAYVSTGALNYESDKAIYESDIKAIHDSGFNFIGLFTSFSYLQGPELQDGMLNESRLRQLDQIIAWCMKYDIHVDIRCTDLSGLDNLTLLDECRAYRDKCINNFDEAATDEFAEVWGALAKRYAEIPNRDLSFNLLVEPEVESEEAYEAFFTPAVNAIREQTPDRCIIADFHSENLTGESMAKLGVALSYHLYEPRNFCAPSQSMTQQELEKVQWPYKDEKGKIYDAQQAMKEFGFISISAEDLINTANTYHVGVMIGEFGNFAEGTQNYWYPIETQRAFLEDMTAVFAEKDLGWCYGVWNGPSGVASEVPLLDGVEYTKLSGTPIYINDDMQKVFLDITKTKDEN